MNIEQACYLFAGAVFFLSLGFILGIEFGEKPKGRQFTQTGRSIFHGVGGAR